MPKIGVIIVTKNEELHLDRCLASVQGVADCVYIVDSFSSDSTVLIARKWGAVCVQREWVNYADQFGFAMATFPKECDWLMRLDADEVLLADGWRELRHFLDRQSIGVTGVEVRRRLYFQGKWMRFGGLYPLWMLRLWRNGCASIESRWMDEHIIVNHGMVVRWKGEIVDDNLKGIVFWTAKHLSYAQREALDLEGAAWQSGSIVPAGQAGSKRRWKAWYAGCPLVWRALLYWIYRYIVLCGFLDGRVGFVFHAYHAFWYRSLVDLILKERRTDSGRNSV